MLPMLLLVLSFLALQANSRPIPIGHPVKHFQGLVEHPITIVSPLSLLHPIISPTLVYRGGPIIQDACVFIVLYGNGTYPEELTNNVLPQWYQDILKSPFLDSLREYNQQDGANVGLGTYCGRVIIDPRTFLPAITDSQLQDELRYQISQGVLQGDANTIFMVYLPVGMTVINEAPVPGVSCLTFCGYHGSFNVGTSGGLLGGLLGGGQTQIFKYGVIPDFSPLLCRLGCGVGTPFEQITQVSSHELAEILTDPHILEPSGAAWYDLINGECADICLGFQGNIAVQDDNSTRVWSVQKIWSNSEGKCIISKDFKLVNTVVAQIAIGGNPGVITIALDQVGGSSQTIALSVVAPTGITASLSATSLNSGSATLTLSAGFLTTRGQKTIRITGAGALYNRAYDIQISVV